MKRNQSISERRTYRTLAAFRISNPGGLRYLRDFATCNTFENSMFLVCPLMSICEDGLMRRNDVVVIVAILYCTVKVDA